MLFAATATARALRIQLEILRTRRFESIPVLAS